MKKSFTRGITWLFLTLILTWFVDWLSLLGTLLIPALNDLPFRVSHFLGCLPISIALAFVIWTLTRLKQLHEETNALRQEIEQLKKESFHH